MPDVSVQSGTRHNWDELIHTSYFHLPQFRKLVCYAIAHSPGFLPTEVLQDDPDYDMLGQWLAEITKRSVE